MMAPLGKHHGKVEHEGENERRDGCTNRQWPDVGPDVRHAGTDDPDDNGKPIDSGLVPVATTASLEDVLRVGTALHDVVVDDHDGEDGHKECADDNEEVGELVQQLQPGRSENRDAAEHE